MLDYALIERDIVTNNIYIDFVYDRHMDLYNIHVNFERETYVMILSEDYDDSSFTFSYYAMMLCAYYETHGMKSFMKAVRGYIEKTPVPRISADMSKAKINIDEPNNLVN